VSLSGICDRVMIAMQYLKDGDSSYHSLHLYAASAVFKPCNKFHLIWNGSVFHNGSCTVEYLCMVQGYAPQVAGCQNSPCLFCIVWFRPTLQGEHHSVFKISLKICI
jgi:hypothetical protein